MTRKPDAIVAQAITMTNLCQALHVLPQAGGLLDQDAMHIYMIECVLSAQVEKSEMEQRKQS
jgi:hypothetical protein